MMARNKEIHFDEAIADSIASDKKIKEEPIKSVIFKAVWIITILFSSIGVIRVFSLSIIQGDYYSKRALANVRQEIPIIAPRGLITDRFGKPLVENKAILSVVIRVEEMIKAGEESEVLKAVGEIFGLNREELLKSFANYDFEKSADFLIAQDISLNQAIAIKSLNLRSLNVADDYKRQYQSPAFAHIIGYVGKTSKDDLSARKDLTAYDSVGRAGLEAYYDDLLRGKNGKKLIYRNIYGKIEKIEEAEDKKIGGELTTTVDAEFQQYFYNRLLDGLRSLGRNSGVGLALNPKNGEVLALSSMPSFDGNNVSEYLSNPYEPLFNRAVAGVYNPGSTIKPIHATAALREGVIVPKGQIFSAGFIEIPNPFDPSHPSRFLDWRPHGWVDLYSAIARSSNVYFYEVVGGFEDQRGVGVGKIIEYWKKFGFDKKTGIDLPGESTGFLPNPEEKEKRTKTIWRIGDTYNIAIGQGDIAVTPLELINAVIAIGTGRAMRPHLVSGPENQVILDLSEFEPQFKEVRKGMEDTVSKPYGTANKLSDLPFRIAAKTGSAQTANNTKINALFVGLAPAHDPQIAILILIENAREGSLNTIPIAKDVLGWYYENRILTNR